MCKIINVDNGADGLTAFLGYVPPPPASYVPTQVTQLLQVQPLPAQAQTCSPEASIQKSQVPAPICPTRSSLMPIWRSWSIRPPHGFSNAPVSNVVTS